MSRNKKHNKAKHAKHAKRRRQMRRYAGLTTERLIKGAIDDALKNQCPKAIRSLSLVRPLVNDPRSEILYDTAVEAIHRRCGAALDVAEELYEEVEDLFPRELSTNPLTGERLKLTKREVEQLALTRNRHKQYEDRERKRSTFKVKSDDIEPATGLPKLKRMNLSVRNIKKALRQGRITPADAKLILNDLDKLNEAKRLTAGMNRPESIVQVASEDVWDPAYTGRGRYGKGKYAKVRRARGEARTFEPQIVSARRKRDPYEPLRERLPRIPQSKTSVTEILTEMETGKMLEREWNPKARKWRTPVPHGKKLKGWW